jgi:ASC-1-like (ASCH) protein
MNLLWLLIFILVLVLALRMFGNVDGGYQIFGGRPKKRSVKKKPAAKKPAAKKPAAKPAAAKPAAEKSASDGHDISESDACIKRAKSGEKTVVARLQAPYFDDMKPGDKINLVSREGDKVEKKLKDKKKYASFEEMFEAEGLENVFPGSASVAAAMEHYRQFYSEEKEKDRGVIALRLE